MNQFDFENQDEAVEEFVEEQQQLDQELSEAERRFEKAQYYRLLLRESFFENTSAEAVEVVEEIRQYIRERMAVLLGIKQETVAPVVEAQFTEEEAAVLKALTAKFLKKPQLMEPPAPKPEQRPTLKKVEQAPTLKKAATPAKATTMQKPVAKATPAKKQPKIHRKPGDNGGVMEYNEETGEIKNVYKNAAGQEVIQSLTTQARPSGAIQPLPPLNEQSMAIVAARHEEQSRKGGVVSKILEVAMK